MRRLALLLSICGTLGGLLGGQAVGSPGRSSASASSSAPSSSGSSPTTPGEISAACLAELERRGVPFRRVARRGVSIAVEITGPLGGITYRYHEPLVIDCSLAVSLDEAGRYLRDLGVSTLTVASAHSRRNVRGTSRPSKHSFGLAIDLPGLEGPSFGTLRVDADYEQGLGDDVDCVGAPLTAGGELLKIVQCQLVRSGLFYLVLSPDYDDAHHDHFHLEARPWSSRDELRSATPAIH
jgi:hypothetical protein